MLNPFKYAPVLANKLKKLDSESREYHKILKLVMNDEYFSSALSKAVATFSAPWLDELQERVYSCVAMLYIFLRICIGTLIATVLLWLGLFNAEAVAVFCALAAFVVALGFSAFYAFHMSDNMEACAEVFLDKYVLYDSKRFTSEKLAQLIAARDSSTDGISPKELNKMIECGCYTCKARFKSNELLEPYSQDEYDSDEYRCPNCGSTDVISSRCGYDVTDELLEDMHEYWCNDKDNIL